MKCLFEIYTHTLEEWEKLFQEKLVLTVSQVKMFFYIVHFVGSNCLHYFIQVFSGPYAHILLHLDENLPCL
jgi:hypothetical protein